MKKLLEINSYKILICIIWVFGLASSIFRIALILKVSNEYGESGSNLLSLSNALVMVFVSIFIGVIIDRYRKTKILIFSNIIQIIGILIMLILAITSSLDLSALLFVGAINSIMFLIINPTVQSMIPDIVESNKIVSKTSVFLNVNAIVGTIGPAIGGIITSNLSFITITYYLVILFILSLILYMFMMYQLKKEDKVINQKGKSSKGNIFIELYNGYIVIINNKIMVLVFCAFAIIDAVTFALPYYLPQYLLEMEVEDNNDVGTIIGLLLAIGMFCRVIAMGIYPKFEKKINSNLIFALNLFAHGISVLFIVFVPILPVKAFGYMLMGFMSGLTMVTLSKFIHNQISTEYKGRVFGSLASITTFFKPIFLLSMYFNTSGEIKSDVSFLAAINILIVNGIIFLFVFKKNLRNVKI